MHAGSSLRTTAVIKHAAENVHDVITCMFDPDLTVITVVITMAVSELLVL